MAIVSADSAPGPPIIPGIQAVSSSEKIVLMWDKIAESSIDSLTGYADFEGYRIYRSTDAGYTWGKSWNRIFDYAGNHVGWRPYAQFDLIADMDSIHCIYKDAYFGMNGETCEENCSADNCTRQTDVNGYDPMANWVDLGDDDSLKRMFIDTDVFDGVEYTYAVTAYDMGMVSFNVEYIHTTNFEETYPPNEDCDANNPQFDEAQCESMPHCYWDVNACVYSNANYCDGNSSYCNGSNFCCDNQSDEDLPCEGKNSYCDCTNGTNICVINASEEECEGGGI